MARTIIFLILIISFLASCEPIFTAEIKNETNHLITLKIKFDKINLQEKYNDENYLHFLKSYPNNNEIEAKDFDTVNLVKTFIIDPSETFPLESHMRQPDFTIFESLTLINNDTIRFYSKQKIKNAFIKTDKRLWQLVIK